MSSITIQPIKAEQTYQLRHQVLRPHQPVESCNFPLDNAPDTYHAGGFLDGKLVGIGTIFREALNGTTSANTWRIRGMAVLPEARGTGIGGLILQSLITHAANHGLSGFIWCNGRANVKGFYERYGFNQEGDIFDMPPIGPHILMTRPLTESDRVLH